MSDLLVEAIMHAAKVKAGDFFPTLWAHVTTYDPEQHAVQVLIPAYTDGTGTPTMSGWIPLITPMAGSGFGIQYVLQGGATYDNPQGGELVLLLVMDDSTGAYMAVGPFFTPLMEPPGASASLSPGELVVKHQTGTQLYFKTDGSLAVTGDTANSGGTSITMSANGQITINVGNSNNVNITGSGQPLLKLGSGTNALALVSLLVNAFNTHTHGGVTTGVGVSAAPVTPWTSATIASVQAKADS